MNDDEPGMRSVRETAIVGKELLDAISEVAAKRQMSRPLVLSLFGLFAKRVIELEVKDGKTEQEAAQYVISVFLRGAGIESVFDNEIDKGRLQ
jgi:hypothetical protein